MVFGAWSWMDDMTFLLTARAFRKAAADPDACSCPVPDGRALAPLHNSFVGKALPGPVTPRRPITRCPAPCLNPHGLAAVQPRHRIDSLP